MDECRSSLLCSLCPLLGVFFLFLSLSVRCRCCGLPFFCCGSSGAEAFLDCGTAGELLFALRSLSTPVSASSSHDDVGLACGFLLLLPSDAVSLLVTADCLVVQPKSEGKDCNGPSRTGPDTHTETRTREVEEGLRKRKRTKYQASSR